MNQEKQILNIADSLNLLKQNYKNYIEIVKIKDFNDFAKKDVAYKNWVISLSNLFNSLYKYYGKKQNSNEWQDVLDFSLTNYKYDDEIFTLIQLLKRYRNKRVHPENNQKIDQFLLKKLVKDEILIELQEKLCNVLNAELQKIDSSELITHMLKGEDSKIFYNEFDKAITKSMESTTLEQRILVEKSYETLKNFIKVFTDDTIITKDSIDILSNELQEASKIIENPAFIDIVENMPNGKETMQFLKKINVEENQNNPEKFYNILMQFADKMETTNNKVDTNN